MQFLGLRTNRKIVLMVLVALLVFLLLVTAVGIQLLFLKSDNTSNVFIGVDVGYGDASDVYTIANAVLGYANLIIIGSLTVTTNTTELTAVCDYLFQKGFYFIVYVGFSNMSSGLPPLGPDASFFQMANSRWGAKFLGAYMFDEAGGKQLSFFSSNPSMPVPLASNYSDAASHYVTEHEPFLYLYKNIYYSDPEMKLLTSDYGLYWYDYLSGYDVVFTELFVGSQTNQLSVSLDRGAAQSQGKNWGAIVTFGPPPSSSSHMPSYTNVTQFYDAMMLAWQNDANYIIVFDAPGAGHSPTTPYGILGTDHLEAMKDFWNYTQNHPQPERDPAQTAYVLPRDYGYGFNGPNDTIWGLWPADSLSSKIWNDTNNLLATYGMKLDIVYETRTDDIPITLPYKTLIFWNGTTINT